MVVANSERVPATPFFLNEPAGQLPGLDPCPYASLEIIRSDWMQTNAFFKFETTVVNIGLGKGAALDTFNNNILTFSRVSRVIK